MRKSWLAKVFLMRSGEGGETAFERGDALIACISPSSAQRRAKHQAGWQYERLFLSVFI
jgi:hypothetical protein